MEKNVCIGVTESFPVQQKFTEYWKSTLFELKNIIIIII